MDSERRYKGVRQRRWGKWVSEIRVPGTRERLWLGSYSTPEAAAVAHDTAVFLLRGPSSCAALNFPGHVAPLHIPEWGEGIGAGLSPRSVQRVASDHGMAADARMLEQAVLPRTVAAGSAGGGMLVPPAPWHQGQGGGVWAVDHAYGRCEMFGRRDEFLDISVDDMEICL